MSSCIFCGESAGFMRKQHQACFEAHAVAATKIPLFFVKSLDSSIEPERFQVLVADIAKSHHVRDPEFRQFVRDGLRGMIEFALAGGKLAEEHARRIETLSNQFGVSMKELGSAGETLLRLEELRRIVDKRRPMSAELQTESVEAII
jgi:hypothetical protein